MKMKVTLGVCFFSTPKLFRLYALPSWGRQPNFRGRIHYDQTSFMFYSYSFLDYTHSHFYTLVILTYHHSKFAEKNVKLVAVAVESLDDNNQWVNEIETVCGSHVNFPIVCDENARISAKYGMVDQSNKRVRERKALNTIRSAFVINPQKEVALILTYPVQVGRNFDEILRAIDALQRNALYDVVTPADWVPSDDTIVSPLYTDEKAEAKFGYMEKKTEYVRFTRDPMAAM